MNKFAIRVLLLAFLATSVTSAVDTKFSTTFRDKAITTANFNKVVVAFITSDTDLRHRIEDGLVRRTKRCVAAYSLVPEEMKDREALRAHLAKSGVDAALVVRVLEHETEKVVISGTSMDVMVPSFYDYWGSWGGNIMTITQSGLIKENRLVIAEIILYSVATGKPIWVGELKETNPKSLRVLLDDLVKAGADELKKQKLL